MSEDGPLLLRAQAYLPLDTVALIAVEHQRRRFQLDPGRLREAARFEKLLQCAMPLAVGPCTGYVQPFSAYHWATAPDSKSGADSLGSLNACSAS